MFGGSRLLSVAILTAIVATLGCGSTRAPKKKVDVGEPGAACEQACRVWGWCAEKDGQCVAASEQHCRDSERCKEGGLCSFSGGDRCLAASSSDCSRSKWCKDYGWCSAEQGVCVR